MTTTKAIPSGDQRGFGEKPQSEYNIIVPATSQTRDFREPDGFSFSQLSHRIWSNSGITVLVFVSGILLTLALVATLMWQSTSHVYNHAIRFNFSGIENGKYPNGQPFNLKDILAPKLVSETYTSIVPGGSEIDEREFKEAFSISSFTPSRQSIISKYQKLLTDRRLTFAETTQLQTKLQTELDAAARGAAVISFDNGKLGLESTIVTAALRGIVDRWNTFSIETRGVLRLELAIIDPRSIDTNTLESLPHVDRVRALSAAYRKVAGLFAGLSNYSGSEQLLNENTGATIDSAQRELAILSDKIVNIARELPAASGTSSRILPQMLTPGAFDNDAVQAVDLPIGFDIVQARLADIRSNTRIISGIEAGDTVQDLDTGLTTSDLENIISELELYHIDPLRSSALAQGLSEKPDDVRNYFEQRIRQMERKKAAIEAVADTLVTVGARYDKSVMSLTTQSGESVSRISPTPVFPQLGDGFLDRLIELAGRSEDASFRQDLAKRSISLMTEASEVQSNISALKEDLETFQTGRASNDIGSQAKPKIEEIRSRLNALLEQLRNYMAVTQRIGARIQSSNEVIAVLRRQLGLEESDPRTSLLTFSSSRRVDPGLLPTIVERLQSLVVVANDFRKELAPSLYGVQALSTSVSTPERVRSPLFSREAVLALVVGFILSIFCALVIGTVWGYGHRKIQTRPDDV